MIDALQINCEYLQSEIIVPKSMLDVAWILH